MNLLLLVLAIFDVSRCSEILRPRGVSISKASLYTPDKDFTCFDGSHTIPFTQVNDDYCDCEDGSDEPGTPACPNGTFHCTNAGHRPLNIPSSRVNDGICDCCDAADEYVSSASCVNNCNELGKAARVEAQKLAKLTKLGNEMRVQLSKKGKQLKQEKKERLEQLEKDRIEAEALKREKEAIKTAAEEVENKALEKYRKIEEEEKLKEQEEEKKVNEQEAFEHFHRLDSNQNGNVELSELQTQQTFDQNKDGAISVEEAKFFLDGKEGLNWEEFLATGWPRMKPFLMLDKGLFKPPVLEPPVEDRTENPQETTLEFSSDNDDDKQFEENQDGSEEEEEGDEEDEEEEEVPDEEETEKIEEPPKYDDETQRLIDEATKTRNDLDEADRALRDVEREIRQIEESLEKDYGVEEEFASLDGECFEYTDLEYIYRLCPFDQVVQRPKSGGGDTRLGTWDKWIGPEENRYLEMMYDKGQSCWNGPHRSTKIKLRCGIENVITAVSEPNRCEYVFEFTTPSICQTLESFESPGHDEL